MYKYNPRPKKGTNGKKGRNEDRRTDTVTTAERGKRAWSREEESRQVLRPAPML
jgi:hypothetical protein